MSTDEHYVIVAYGEDSYITLPRPFEIDYPEGRFASAKEAADAFFSTDVDSAFPLGIYGVPYQPFRGVDRYDVSATGIASDVQAQFEITVNWVRVYLHPALRGSKRRADLEGQPIEGMDIIDRIQQIVTQP